MPHAVDKSATDDMIDFDLDHFLIESRPEAKAMQDACASGNLTAVQSVFNTWLDRPAHERIDQDVLGASGLCEAIKRNDASIAQFLLSNVTSMESTHFAMAVEYQAYAILQLYVDRGWNINTYLSRMRPPALS